MRLDDQITPSKSIQAIDALEATRTDFWYTVKNRKLVSGLTTTQILHIVIFQEHLKSLFRRCTGLSKRNKQAYRNSETNQSVTLTFEQKLKY